MHTTIPNQPITCTRMNYDPLSFTGELGKKLEYFKIPKTEMNHPNNIYIEPNLKSSSPMDYFVKSEAVVTPAKPKPNTTADLKRKQPNNNGSNNEISMSTDEDPLPKELTKQFMPLFCELCGVHSNSTVSAKMHYDSKNHDKKIAVWLHNWSQETGEPIPKRKKLKEGSSGPNAYHCKDCDLPLTSLQNANQHYQGRKHLATVSGRSGPSGSGFYDTDGNWIRTPKPTPDPTGRFNIGSGFLPDGSNPTPVVDTNPDVYCAVCNISVSAKNEMKMHLEGTKHAKKLKAAGQAPYSPFPNDTILKSITTVATSTTDASNKPRDHSINRTPSGHFYCKTCNVTVATELMFNQHLASKKHTRRNKQSA